MLHAMCDGVRAITAVRSALAARRDLRLEVLALRHQLAVLARSNRRFQLSDRLLWLFLRRLWPQWRDALLLAQPATVDRWHRGRSDRRWWRRRRHPGRPPIDAQIRDLIWRLADENRLWGAPRIHGELLKLGVAVSERTVSRYLRERPRAPSQTWRTFLANHLAQMTWTSAELTLDTLVDDGIDASAERCHSTSSSDWRCQSPSSRLVAWAASVQHTFVGGHLTNDHSVPRKSSGRAPPLNPRPRGASRAGSCSLLARLRSAA
jgi:hypothetical protein